MYHPYYEMFHLAFNKNRHPRSPFTETTFHFASANVFYATYVYYRTFLEHHIIFVSLFVT